MGEAGTLRVGEPHPSARIAFEWIRAQPSIELHRWLESFYSVSLSGNRLAEVCAETLRRLVAGEDVSDRYILGLYVAMRYDHTDLKPVMKRTARKEKVKNEDH